MTAWTVQCRYAAYYARTETVEAETLEDACTRAVERANASGGWTALDPHCGPAFVAAVAEGEGGDEGRFTERGEPPLPTLSGDVSPGTVSVERGAAALRARGGDRGGRRLRRGAVAVPPARRRGPPDRRPPGRLRVRRPGAAAHRGRRLSEPDRSRRRPPIPSHPSRPPRPGPGVPSHSQGERHACR